MLHLPTARPFARALALGVALLAAPVLTACSSDGEVTLANVPEGLIVDPFLWQGALDALGSVPIASADPSTGRIDTGWHNVSGRPGEEVRVLVQIYPGELSANSVAVEVFRRLNGAPVGVNPQSAADIHGAILLRARQIRSSLDE